MCIRDRVSTDTETPYEWTWENPKALQHTLSAIAYDEAGNFARDDLEVLAWKFHPGLIMLFLVMGVLLRNYIQNP